MTPLWREQAVHAIDVALAEAIYSLAVLPALIQRQTDVPASPTKLLGGADQFNRRWAEQYTAAATSLFGDSDQFSGFLCHYMNVVEEHRLADLESGRIQTRDVGGFAANVVRRLHRAFGSRGPLSQLLRNRTGSV